MRTKLSLFSLACLLLSVIPFSHVFAAAPAISLDNVALEFEEGDGPTQIDSAGTVSDADGDSDWDGGTLVVQITANASGDDQIRISDVDGDGTAITVSGTNILANGTDIGDLSATSGLVSGGTALTITFDSDATNANVQETLQSLRFEATGNDPSTATRTVTITATDKNSDSANDTRTINVTAINNEPTLTATGNDPTFTEGGSASDLFSGISVSTIEVGQTITSLTFTVTNVNDGSNERINVDGTAIVLTHGTAGTTATNSLSYSVSVTGTTATVTLSGGTMTTTATLFLVDGMSYQNNSGAPNTSNRVVTLTSIVDSGSNTGDNDNTAALAISSTVTVVDVFPTVTSATYDAATGALVVTGTNFEAKSGAANDVDASTFTITGEGGATYTLTDTPDVEIDNATQFTLTLSATDRTAVNALLNKDGLQSVDNTTYNLAAADDFIANETAGDTSDLTGNGITVSNSDTTPPVISSVSATPADTTATITWTTDELASSQVHLGLANNTTTAGAVTDTSPRVTSHSVGLIGLLACTTYEFKVTSEDAASNSADSSVSTFTTTGCEGTSDGYFGSPFIPNGAPYATSMVKTSESAEITPSTNYSGTCDASFQFQDLVEGTVLGSTGASPTGENPAMAYALSAYCDTGTQLTTFDNPLTVKFSYSDAHVSSLNESTLKIYRWGGAGWNPLSGCIVDLGQNFVTCETTQFSTFGLFGSGPISGSAAKSNDVITVCENGKCFSKYPTGDDDAYDAYLECKQTRSGIDCATEWAIAKGYDFPEIGVQTRTEAASHASAPEPVEEVAEEIPLFEDLSESHPYYDAIYWMADHDIVSGYPDGTFRPDDSINRVEFLKIVLGAAGMDENLVCRAYYNYSDVDWSAWYGNYVQKASCTNIVQGYPDQTFRPNDTINFVEAAKVAVMALGFEVTQTDGPWYEPYVEVLANNEAIPPSISDDAQALTRGEMAQIVWSLSQ